MNRNRKRTTVAVLATAGTLTAAQLGLAGTASAATASPQSTGCPINIVYPTRFYIDSNGWVTNGGLYFGIKSKTTESFKKVTFTVTNVKNIRFGTARPKGGKITHKTSKTVSVYTKTFKGKASLGFKVRTRLLNKNSYKVKFTLRGSGWNCAVDQGTWGV
ncbi:hypothetical protein [Streptomyces cavernae]|uniref:hypothetical protein n=1 Tax=Streptomyces cavernae TaxID=2259034 RepID=UPI000FEBD4E1|nr:hypothetical protein [Streptomyces cavernae]